MSTPEVPDDITEEDQALAADIHEQARLQQAEEDQTS